jgi:exodeoxyribonuclease V beta subunit
VVLDELPQPTRARWTREGARAALEPARALAAPIPAAARTTSFSGLTRAAHDAAQETRVRTDDAQGGEAAAAERSEEAPLLARAVLPAGPAWGDLVHRIFEGGLARISTPAFEALVARECAAAAFPCDPATLAAGLRSVARQPLAQDAAAARAGSEVAEEARAHEWLAGATLETLGAGRMRAELEYLLPIGAATRPMTLRAVAAALAQGGAAARRYAPVAAGLGPEALHGHLVGFMDLVAEHRGRWWVLDYKTNALGAALDAYRPEALEDAMVSSHYVLQYHLYALALHRWLRVRLPGYEYERHFGGAAYTFVRAMGERRPAGSGVFVDRPSERVMAALDAAFEGRSP